MRSRLVLATILAMLCGLMFAAPAFGQEPTGSATVNKFDGETEEPLADACFEVWEQGEGSTAPVAEQQCTTAEGTTVFEDLPYGEYMLVETQAPEGYEFVEPIPFSIEEGAEDPVLDVPNFRSPPAEGVLEVDKLVCENADEPTMTVYENPGMDPEDPIIPVSDEEVHPCQLGNATFQVTGDNLEEPMYIETGYSGFQITFLPAGDYEITEVEPNEVGPMEFTLDPGGFVLVVGINPHEADATPAPSVAPAPTRAPTTGGLPNTGIETVVQPSAWMLGLFGTSLVGAIGLNVVARRRR